MKLVLVILLISVNLFSDPREFKSDVKIVGRLIVDTIPSHTATDSFLNVHNDTLVRVPFPDSLAFSDSCRASYKSDVSLLSDSSDNSHHCDSCDRALLADVSDSSIIARRVDISGVTENYHTKRSGDSLANSFVYDNDTSTIMTEKLFLNDVETACQVGGGCDSIVTIDNKEIKKVYVGDLIGTHSIIKGIGASGYLSKWVNSDSIGNSYTKDSSNLIGGNDTIATLSGATLKKQSLDSLIIYKEIHTGSVSDYNLPRYSLSSGKFVNSALYNYTNELFAAFVDLKIENGNVYSYNGSDSSYFGHTVGIQMKGAATQWKDVQFSINTGLPGAAAPTKTTVGCCFSLYAFDIGDEITLNVSEILHGFNENSDSVEFHIHAYTGGLDETDRTIAGRCYFSVTSVGETITDTQDSLSFEGTIPASTAAYTNLYIDIGSISVSNYNIDAGDMAVVKIKRIASSGTEPSSDPIFAMLGVHVEMSAIGSINEVP